MYPVLFDLGFFKIYTYGFCIALGVIAGIWMACRLGKRYDIPADFILDLSVKLLLGGIIGSKLLYIIVSFREIMEDPANLIINLRSGFVFLGGFILAFIIGYRSIKKSPYKNKMNIFYDIFAPALPLAHAFGRIGCTMAGCCYGKIAKSESVCTLEFCNELTAAHPRCVPLIATQPISAVFLFILSMSLLMLFYKWKSRKQGSLIFIYIILYSIFRFIIEFFRGDYRGGLFFFSTSQIISLIIIPITLYMIIKINRKFGEKNN